ncbi:hypothetical protein HDV62DRAFT_374154 [Trichoderma sp. SZMC 28011]
MNALSALSFLPFIAPFLCPDLSVLYILLFLISSIPNAGEKTSPLFPASCCPSPSSLPVARQKFVMCCLMRIFLSLSNISRSSASKRRSASFVVF